MVNAGMLLNGFLGVVHLKFLSINECHVGKSFKENLDNNIRQNHGNMQWELGPVIKSGLRDSVHACTVMIHQSRLPILTRPIRTSVLNEYA